jgi:hypothetical protein
MASPSRTPQVIAIDFFTQADIKVMRPGHPGNITLPSQVGVLVSSVLFFALGQADPAQACVSYAICFSF